MEGPVKLRPLAADDIETVLAILARSAEASQWSRADCEFAARGPGQGWVVEAESGVVGFLMARCVAGEIEILNLAVSPEARRRGAARSLVAEALSWGKSSGARKAFLEVRESNHAAIRLYESLGFVTSGSRARYYANPTEDGLILTRSLE